jgi:hypothetical protein
MSIKQFLAIAEQTVRGEAPENPQYLAYPVKGKLEPEPDFKEEEASEWRGIDSAQGNTGENEERTSTSQKYAWESRIYPGSELALLLKYIFGTASAPVALSAPDDAASRYLFHTTSEKYGEGTPLLDGALMLVPNTRKGSSTYSQEFLGHRPKDLDLSFKGGEAAEMKINFMSGPWIGDPEQAPIEGVEFPQTKAFRSVPKVYLGAGAAVTGPAGAYTDFAPGTMAAAKPDDLTVKMDLGEDDVWKMNGVEGPSVTERKKSIGITVEYTHDFADPSNGWSSYDAWTARFGGIQFLPFMLILDSPELVTGCDTQKYQLGLYVPRMKITPEPVDRKNDGSKDKVKFKLEGRVDPDVNVAAFCKLIC